MRRFTGIAVFLMAGPAFAQDGERFVERTPPRKPIAHTQEQSGYSGSIAKWAIPGVSPHEAGGYVGGARVSHNNALAKNTMVAGPVADGTFGWDYAGWKQRTGRIFLRESADPSRGREFNRLYRTDYPFKVPDVIAAQPFNKAVREAKREHQGEPE